MMKYTPRPLRGMRFYMVKASIMEMVLACLIFFTQYRVLPNKKSLAVVCYGPSSIFSQDVCFYAFFTLLIFGCESVLSIAHTIYYQCRNADRTSKTLPLPVIILQTSITFIPLFVLQMLIIMMKKDFAAVQEETELLHPDVRNSGGVVSGFAEMYDPLNIIAVGVLGLIIYGTPFFSIHCKRIIYQRLFAYEASISQRTRENAKTFIRALNFQAMIPAICYIPPFTIFVYNQYFGSEMPLTSLIIPLTISIPTIIHPAITLYFIQPYRRAVMAFIKRDRLRRRSSIFPSNDDNSKY
ncbi:unnamed protein product [Caenorhabditis auriculariae]|uniref:Uncharacterized protein n=1 Tax=Caenorhabditis auriculariae TaxID=2777116 RepID=A0A8S1HAK5_9PELO|nr:unnamed protein product [Caenorhabditis auriculariae]